MHRMNFVGKPIFNELFNECKCTEYAIQLSDFHHNVVETRKERYSIEKIRSHSNKITQ